MGNNLFLPDSNYFFSSSTMPSPSYKQKELMDYFFTQCEDKDYYVCNNPKCGTRKKQKVNTGYTNLKNHLRSCVGSDFEEVYVDLLKSSKGKGRLDSYGFINSKEKDVFQVLEWIVMRNHPLSEVDNQLTRTILTTKPISSKTLRKYILSLTPHVEKAIADDLPALFALEFDGWTSGSVHYVALFASYMKNGVHKETLLALAPLLNEETLGAEQHIEFIGATLELYNKALDNVVAFIGDNCATNRKISNETNIPLIGCASHRFNLAIHAWLKENEEFSTTLEAIHDLMIQLRQLKNSARLRSLTDLCPVIDNITRWSSKYEMAKRYIRIEAEVKEIEELDDYVLSTRSRRILDTLMNHLSKFESITKNLQKRGISPDMVRSVFDVICDDYPAMRDYLHHHANIVNNPDFESGLVKIMARDFLNLSEGERRAIYSLKKVQVDEHSTPSSAVDKEYFEECKSRKRRRLSEEEEQYIDCSFCVATSNTVERLFSACKYVLTDQRKSMSPIMFEALMFLQVNRDFWDLPMLAKAMKNQSPRGAETDLDSYYQ